MKLRNFPFPEDNEMLKDYKGCLSRTGLKKKSGLRMNIFLDTASPVKRYHGKPVMAMLDVWIRKMDVKKISCISCTS